MVDSSNSFQIADYAIFGVTIAISISIGIYYALSGSRQRTTSEYLVGGRTMKFLPVAISLVVSFESSIMMLGMPAETYVHGIQLWICLFSYIAAHILAIFVVVPLLHPLRITSAYEYFQYRFHSTAVRLLGCILGMSTNVFYMGVVLFGPAVALEAVTGFPQWSSILAVATAAVIYTTIGGIKAVVWTDVFQTLIMYAGMLAILIKGTIDVGGPATVWHVADEAGRLNFFNFDFDPRTRHTFWNLLFGGFLRAFSWNFNQSSVQRLLSVSTQREAKWIFLVMAPVFFVSSSLACYEGTVIFTYYQTQGCDPLESEKITNSNQIVPFAVMDIFKSLPGMPGLFLASLFSASLSTLSSVLSSLSALLWTDIIKPRIGQVSEFQATLITKISVVAFGVLGCGVALLVSMTGGTLIQITGSLLSASGGPLTGLFILGCFFPGANAKGALAGGLFSFAFTSWLSLGKSFSKNVKREPWLPPASTEMCLANHSASLFSTTPDDGLDSTTIAVADDGPQGIEHMYTLSYQWLAAVGILVTLIVGVIVSWASGGNKEDEVDPRCVLSFCDNLCCYLPQSVRKMFRCAGYTTVQAEETPPLQEQYVTTNVTQTASSEREENDTMILMTTIDEHVTGNDDKKMKL